MRRSAGLSFPFTVRPPETLPNLALAAESGVRGSEGIYAINTIANVMINIFAIAIEIELEQGVLIFRVSSAVQEHIETLVEKIAIHNSLRTRLKNWSNMRGLMII
jgi:hypothetical protein